MLTRAKKLTLKLVSPSSLLNNVKSSGYSNYLQVTKPLLDTAKRGRVLEQLADKFNEIEVEMMLVEESPMLLDSPKYKSIYLALQESHTAMKTSKITELKSSQFDLIEQMRNGFDLQEFMYDAFQSKDYQIESKLNGFFIVRRNNARALVIVRDTSEISDMYDNQYDSQFIAKARALCLTHQGDATIVLTAGNVANDTRSLSKANDIFCALWMGFTAINKRNFT